MLAHESGRASVSCADLWMVDLGGWFKAGPSSGKRLGHLYAINIFDTMPSVDTVGELLRSCPMEQQKGAELPLSVAVGQRYQHSAWCQKFARDLGWRLHSSEQRRERLLVFRRGETPSFGVFACLCTGTQSAGRCVEFAQAASTQKRLCM